MMGEQAPKLRLSGVSKHFVAPRTGQRTVAVQDVSLDIQTGEFVCVVGPSGCGKSTVLNMIAGLDAPTTGVIEANGVAIRGPGADRGVMFQDYALFPWLTVQDNVGFGLNHGTPGGGFTPEQREARVRHHVELVHLNGSEKKYPHQLSGGMRQRVALARTLAMRPGLILLDEPFSALDAQTKLVLQRRFAISLHEAGVTCVLITHDLQEAVTMADRVVVLSGRPGTVIDGFDVDLPDRFDPLARATHPGTGAYVRRLFDTLHIADAA